AHAYTMASFLSRTNDRGDGYGGSREGRLRLPLEVLAAVREVQAAQARGFAVGCRMLGDEVIDGGSTPEDAVAYARAFAAAGIDFISISKGGKFDDAKQPKVGDAVYPYTGRSGYECMPTVFSDARGPFARNVPLAAAIRAAIRGDGHDAPIVTAGGINAFDQAEAILAAGDADIVAAARQSLADPDWFLKIRTGQGDAIRRCKFTNYCEALDTKHKQVTCQLWDREAIDVPGIRLAHDGRRRLVAPPWSPPRDAGAD
ncbi:MAG: NADH:flavin oxidoreductase, partial [Myxococcales bacterium]|nr:NADH:flavin oxidoreductase [Myxococcales bacterium]